MTDQDLEGHVTSPFSFHEVDGNPMGIRVHEGAEEEMEWYVPGAPPAVQMRLEGVPRSYSTNRSSISVTHNKFWEYVCTATTNELYYFQATLIYLECQAIGKFWSVMYVLVASPWWSHDEADSNLILELLLHKITKFKPTFAWFNMVQTDLWFPAQIHIKKLLFYANV